MTTRRRVLTIVAVSIGVVGGVSGLAKLVSAQPGHLTTDTDRFAELRGKPGVTTKHRTMHVERTISTTLKPKPAPPKSS